MALKRMKSYFYFSTQFTPIPQSSATLILSDSDPSHCSVEGDLGALDHRGDKLGGHINLDVLDVLDGGEPDTHLGHGCNLLHHAVRVRDGHWFGGAFPSLWVLHKRRLPRELECLCVGIVLELDRVLLAVHALLDAKRLDVHIEAGGRRTTL